jgi:hypothetical protein
LADPYLKTTRAKKHLDSLRNALDAFCKSRPYSVVGEDDVERDRYRFRMKLNDPPEDIWLIAGDLFCCMRAALDQLVWALAKLTLQYPRNTQFPIFDTPNPKRFDRYTSGVPAGAAAIIESLQPYYGGNPSALTSHLLWQLNLMCNIDKHRRIPVHGSESIFVFPDLPISARQFVELDSENNVASLPARFKSQITLDPEVQFKIVFGDLSEGLSLDLSGIERIYNFVADDVLPRFTRFFK